MSTRANIVLIHGAVGDQPGVRLGGDVPAEPVPPLRPGLAGVPGLRVDGGDHPVRRHSPCAVGGVLPERPSAKFS